MISLRGVPERMPTTLRLLVMTHEVVLVDQRPRHLLRRRADVEDHRAAVGDHRRRRRADRLLLRRRHRPALGIGDVGDAGRDHRAAVDAGEQAHLAELVQVAADGLGGDLEGVRQPLHLHPSDLPCTLEDLGLSLAELHGGLVPHGEAHCDSFIRKGQVFRMKCPRTFGRVRRPTGGRRDASSRTCEGDWPSRGFRGKVGADMHRRPAGPGGARHRFDGATDQLRAKGQRPWPVSTEGSRSSPAPPAASARRSPCASPPRAPPR